MQNAGKHQRKTSLTQTQTLGVYGPSVLFVIDVGWHLASLDTSDTIEKGEPNAFQVQRKTPSVN